MTGVGLTVWMTGLPGAGKSTAASGLAEQLEQAGIATQILDGDILREGLNAQLGFSKEDRTESTRRAGEIALLLTANGIVAVVSLVSPYQSARDDVRRRHRDKALPFFEVWVSTPLAVCESRDPKGLYGRARRGEVAMMTGVDDPYEPPDQPELVLHADIESVADSVANLTAAVRAALGR